MISFGTQGCMDGCNSCLWKPQVHHHAIMMPTKSLTGKTLNYKADEASCRDLVINALASTSLKDLWIQDLHSIWVLLLLKGVLSSQPPGTLDELGFCLKSQPCQLWHSAVWHHFCRSLGWTRASGFPEECSDEMLKRSTPV